MQLAARPKRTVHEKRPKGGKGIRQFGIKCHADSGKLLLTGEKAAAVMLAGVMPMPIMPVSLPVVSLPVVSVMAAGVMVRAMAMMAAKEFSKMQPFLEQFRHNQPDNSK